MALLRGTWLDLTKTLEDTITFPSNNGKLEESIKDQMYIVKSIEKKNDFYVYICDYKYKGIKKDKTVVADNKIDNKYVKEREQEIMDNVKQVEDLLNSKNDILNIVINHLVYEDYEALDFYMNDHDFCLQEKIIDEDKHTTTLVYEHLHANN